MKTKKGVTWFDISEGMRYPLWYVAITKGASKEYHLFSSMADGVGFIRSLDPYTGISNHSVILDCVAQKEDIGASYFIDHRIAV